MLFLVVALSLVATGYCGNYTVTKEAWFDIEIRDMDGPGEHYTGRFEIALFGDSAPMSVLNFATIAKGFTKKTAAGRTKTLGYKDTKIHRIVKDFVIQMGDITTGDGTGGVSIFGDIFNDEDFVLSHRAPGMVAMANHGPDTNGSQFYILLSKARWLDNKHVVFGKVIRGFEVVRTIGELDSDDQTAVPKKTIKITKCGVNETDKYELTEEQIDSTEDI